MADKIILDWNEYLDTARKTVAEGCVLLKNDNSALPLEKDCRVAVFGRIGTHYYKSGSGSGGMVNVSKVVGIIDGLKESGSVIIDGKLEEIYAEWEKTHPYDKGFGWGCDLWSQEEMPINDAIAADAASRNDAAIIIIGRTAGEDKDNINEKGGYLLSDTEDAMIGTVRRHFSRVIVLLNVGGIMDMSFVDKHSPDAVMYVWQGGMTGGSGTADVLTGKISPCGKLSDTIAYSIDNYPAHKYFGDENRNFYCEDIYVGYRYFETFAKDKVRYPFGYGLSYTNFDISLINGEISDGKIKIEISVKNTGSFSGKEVVQIYAECPQGKLGKPLRSLISFKKTDLLSPDTEQRLIFETDFSYLASYDDSGITGHKSCFVLESGTYNIYAGSDVRSAEKVLSFEISDLIVTQQLGEALAPVLPFDIMRPVKNGDKYDISFIPVSVSTIDMDKTRAENLCEEITYTGNVGIKLCDVLSGKNTMNEFIAQMSDDDLSCIIRGEGMGSPKVTPGTASAFGGVSDGLLKLGIPVCCCDDGPSGMRLDSGAKAFSLPIGTLIACTFNPELAEELFAFTSAEMVSNKVECLLGPGMNIHRHPLNGRNFEYFSEDPYLTGIMASAEIKGLKKHGVTGTIKHFCGNNQEKRRHFIDSVISERALREIYLRGFEMAVKLENADSVMTTYGAVNGLWTAGSYDLNTTILRNEWGFKGIVMTDWFAKINERGKEAVTTNFAAMIRSQNDIYMVCPDGAYNSMGDNTLESLENGSLTRGELQRCAANLCEFIMHTQAMNRFMKNAPSVEIINRPDEDTDCDISNLKFKAAGTEFSEPLDDRDSGMGANYSFAYELATPGKYEIAVTGSSELGELAQIPCTLFVGGLPLATFTFTGTNGQYVNVTRRLVLANPHSVMRLNVGQNGVKLKSIHFKLITPLEQIPEEERYILAE